MNAPIRRVQHKIKGHSTSSIYGGMVWLAAVVDEKSPTIEQQTADILTKLDRMLAAARSATD